MPRLPQKFPPKESNSELQSDVEKYDDVLDSLDSLQTRRKNLQPESDSSIKPTTLIMVIIIVGILSVILLSFGSGTGPNEGKDYLFGSFEAGTSITEGLDVKIELLDESQIWFSDYIGEPIILDLFATWCEPCLTQISHLQTIHDQYPNVRILSISIDLSDTRTMLTSYKADHNMDWVVGRDITRQGASIYDAFSIPTMVFFDADGKLQHYEVGVTGAATIISWINGN
jgi:thiol-disulfide isomerase/thioredoxin